MSEYSDIVLRELPPGFKFAPDFGHGVVFDYEGEWGKETVRAKLKSVVRREKGPRHVELKLSSYCGISPGAEHTYARLFLGWIDYVYASNGKAWRMGSPEYSYDVPLQAKLREIQLVRVVDARDIKHDKDTAKMRGDSLYGRMKKGSTTQGFWTEEEAIAFAKKWFLEHFDEGWILVCEHYYEGCEGQDTIYASTVKESK